MIVIAFACETQKAFTPNWQREHPTACLVMRLRKNDLVMLDEENRSAVYFVQKISGTRVTLAPNFEANVDARNRSGDDQFS